MLKRSQVLQGFGEGLPVRSSGLVVDGVEGVGDRAYGQDEARGDLSSRTVYDLTIYTAEPGSTSEERFKLLTILPATQPAHPTSQPRPRRGRAPREL
ncbi:hypothetical protein ABZW11_39135 [Nonomuraea sp. NPDC004580]|uniref:hypothetical protein n=1 Tax=Nonomuraea sp. NPDC004580 TaxID=3154552 RepID=UPI0033AFF5F2